MSFSLLATLERAGAEIVGRPTHSRPDLGLIHGLARSDSGWSRIVVTIDAKRVGARYVRMMRTAALLAKRRAFDALVVSLAALGQLEVWLGSAREPRLAVAAGTLLATLPLLLRRRFPLGVPVFVFAALAALSVVRPEAVQDGTTAMLLALLSAFWIVGAHPGREEARRNGRRPRGHRHPRVEVAKRGPCPTTG